MSEDKEQMEVMEVQPQPQLEPQPEPQKEVDSPRKIVRVVIAVPNEGHTLPEGYDNRMQMCLHLGNLQTLSHFGKKEYDKQPYAIPDNTEFKFYFSAIGRVLTPLARERLTQFALEGQVDYMFWIDDDMIAPVDAFERLYARQKDVVGALAFQRLAPHYPVVYQVNEGYDTMVHREYFDYKIVKNYPKDSLVECDGVGFGCVLLDMKVIKGMNPPYFMSTTGAGEDIWFCYKARRAGFKIYMDTAVKLGHVGLPPIIEEQDFEREFKTNDFRKTWGDWKMPKRQAFEKARAI